MVNIFKVGDRVRLNEQAVGWNKEHPRTFAGMDMSAVMLVTKIQDNVVLTDLKGPIGRYLYCGWLELVERVVEGPEVGEVVED